MRHAVLSLPLGVAGIVCAGLFACGTSGSGSDPAAVPPNNAEAGTDAPTIPPVPTDAGPYVPLGLNDVTILVPAPSSPSEVVLFRASDVMGDGQPLVPRAQVTQLATEPIPESPMGPVPADVYDRLVVVAVRFDLCDRSAPSPCHEAGDGSIRLVLQPYRDGGFDDVSFHAFYTVAWTEVGALVKQFRDLARIAPTPRTAPLGVSPPLAARNAAYADALRAILEQRAGGSKFHRLTMNAQPLFLSQVRWVLRGTEKRDDKWTPVVIPGMEASTQEAITVGKDGFESKPALAPEFPPGFNDAIDDQKFAAATDARKRELLKALASVDHPGVSAVDNVSCMACHVSTPLMLTRTASMGIDPKTVEGRYTSSFDLSIGNTLGQRRVIRVLGYLGTEPLVAQRVVNDSAQLATEIDARFPPP